MDGRQFILSTIFVHGLGQNPLCWQSTISYLTKKLAITCSNLFDLRLDQNETYEKLYETFVAYCNKISPPLNLCGISLGAILALNYAIDFPKRVNSLVLIAAQFKMPRFLMRCQNILFHMIPEKHFLKSGVNKKVMIQLTKSMLALDFTKELKHILCPVLVACGAKDRVNKKAAIVLATRLKKASYQSIENAGHEVNIDAPRSLALLIETFYKNL